MRFCGKIISIVLFSFLFCFGTSFKANIELGSFDYKTEIALTSTYNPNAYTTIDQIFISYDSSFEDYGFSGDGSKSNPFLIENYNVTPLMDVYDAVHISFTTSYFIIRNCLISSAGKGIIIEEIANGTCIIEDNIFTDTDICIQTIESDGLVIEENFGSNNIEGLNIDESDASKIIGNKFNIDEMGPTVGSQGMFFYRLRNSFVEHNIVENYQVSIYAHSSIFNNMINNTCTNNTSEIAFLLCDCYYLNVIGNTIQNCTNIGLKLNGTSSGNIISHNLIEDCTSYGIQIEDFKNQNNTLHHNNLLNNNLLGSSQGSDNGLHNNWFCITELEGNYWSDWSGTGYYTISGSAASEDIYPLNDEIIFDISVVEIQLFSQEVDDSYEDNDFFSTSVPIDNRNETYQLMGWDADWFEIHLKSYQILTLIVTYIGYGLDISAAITQDGPDWVLEYSDIVGWSEIIIFTSIAEGDYKIGLEFHSLATLSPNYTMIISISDDPEFRDEYEDNDSIEDAKTIAVDDNSYDLIYNDKDYFNVSLTAGFKFTAIITFSYLLLDLDLFLITLGDDYDELIVAKSTTNEDFERMEYIVTTSKNYYLLVASTNPDENVVIPIDYTLTVLQTKSHRVPVFVLLPLIFTMTSLYYKRKTKKNRLLSK